MEDVAGGIVHRPPGAPGDGDVRDALAGANVDDGDRARVGDGGVADVGNEQPCAARIVGEAVGPDADDELFDLGRVRHREQANGILATIRREHQVGLRHERPRDSWQPGDGHDVPLRGDVDHVDGVVGGMCHVNAARRLVYRRVIEATGRGMRGQVDEAEGVQRHLSARPPAP